MAILVIGSLRGQPSGIKYGTHYTERMFPESMKPRWRCGRSRSRRSRHKKHLQRQALRQLTSLDGKVRGKHSS